MLGTVERRSRRGGSVASIAAALVAALVGGCGSEESAVDAPSDPGAGVTFPLEVSTDSGLEGLDCGRDATRFGAHSD